MGDETPISSQLILNVLVRPIMKMVIRFTTTIQFTNYLEYIFQLERRDSASSQTLSSALTKAEQSHPGVTYDLIMGIIRKAELNVNMNESILRLQGASSDTDCKLMGSLFFLSYKIVIFCFLYASD